MRLRNSLLCAVALSAMATFAACGDHRTEEFCQNVCACAAAGDPLDIEACTVQCTDNISVAEEQSNEQIISNECFTCVSDVSCQRLETACEAACQSTTDALNQEPPIPEPDPQPGVP